MKKLFVTLLVITAFILSMGCEKQELNDDLTRSVTGSGEIVTKNLSLPPFDRIDLTGVSDIYVITGEEQSTVLKAQQNIIDVMTWEVSANTLIIGLEENTSIQNSDKICFEIEIPECRQIMHNGVGDYKLSGDQQESLIIEHNGVGDIDAYQLSLDECLIYTSGTGDCKVKVNDFLEVHLSGIGNVFYKGNPEIESEDSGLGDLINDN